MANSLIHPAKRPPDPMESVYGNHPVTRPWLHPDMRSVNVRDLFPTMPACIYDGDEANDLEAIRVATRKALENVDMSDIKPEHTVNICCCEHGFLMFGGGPYVEMIKTIKKVVEERTGNYNIRLRLVMYRTPREGYEVIEHYHLDEEFESIKSVAAYDKAVPVETYVGTLYALEPVYDADKFIFAYYDDPREVWGSKYYRKSFKAFTMDMARFETRAIYHRTIGSNSGNGALANISALAMYDSEFVQSKYTFSCFVRTTPAGVLCIDADNDLRTLDDRCCETALKFYPYMHQLLISPSDYAIILDQSRWGYYPHGAGLIAGINFINWADFYDLDAGRSGKKRDRGSACAPGFKACIINQMWIGLALIALPMTLKGPVIIVGDELWTMLKGDQTNKEFFNWGNVYKADTLDEAMKMATEMTGTTKFACYDGSYGFLNCTEGFAEALIENVPAVKEKVDARYIKYMAQRGLEIPDYMK